MKAEQVREIRERLRLSQAELAGAVGAHANTVARWERGELAVPEPSARLLERLEVDGIPDPLTRAEREAQVHLAGELEKPSLLTHVVYGQLAWVFAGTARAGGLDDYLSMRVGLRLLARVSNDLRCSTLLAYRGYSTQAATLAASIFEVAFTIAYIGNDEDRAEQWAEHEDPIRSFRSVEAMVKDFVLGTGVADASAEATSLYQVYSQLCMPKHANPLIEKSTGFVSTDGKLTFLNGPEWSATSVRLGIYALVQAATFADFAGEAYRRAHLAAIDATDWEAGRAQARALIGDIHDIAKARGWKKDPFRRRWKALEVKPAAGATSRRASGTTIARKSSRAKKRRR